MKRTAATASVEFALDCLVDYSTDSLLAELRRVAALVDGRYLSLHAFERFARVSYGPYRRRFGGWSQALAEAGLAHRDRGHPVTAKMRAKAVRRMSDDEILDELRQVMKRKGRAYLRIHDLDASCRVGYWAVKRRFGSWHKLLQRLGVAPLPQARRFTNQECFDNLRAVWRTLGRRPRGVDLNRPPSTIGWSTYANRFGTLRRALAEFVARESGAGAPGVGEKEPVPSCAPPAQQGPKTRRVKREPKDLRVLPLWLRYAVLQRDRYACRACGDSPAKGKGCTLEVDHIVPYARGGLTVMENLRTLCRRCNRGKGARMPGMSRKLLRSPGKGAD